MAVGADIRAMLRPRGVPSEKVGAALRCLILLTVFSMAWVAPAGVSVGAGIKFLPFGRSTAFDLVVLVGALYVLATTFLPWSRYDVRRTSLVMSAMDVLLITALIYTQSGVRSEYYLLYYLPILNASVRLGLRDAAGTCVLAAAAYFLVGILERPDTTVTTTVISRVLTFSISAGLLAGFFMMLSRERRAFDRLTKHYEEATKAKSEFLSRVSHEFRTPLTAIVGFSQLLYEHKQELDPNRQHEYLTVIREQSQQLARMIEDMLDITRIDDGRLRLNQTACRITDIIESSLMLLDSQAERDRVSIAAPTASPIVWADRGEMEQAFSRIIYNALEASGDEAVVSMAVSMADDNKNDVKVTVEAPGLNITDEDMAAVFGPSAAVLTQKPSSGRALGLAVSRALIEMHGGRVWAEDNKSGGSTIHVMVPRYRVKEGGPNVIVGLAAEAGIPGAAQA
ncbi:MAG: sensor histidine kinase [Armatimonadota bacterium]